MTKSARSKAPADIPSALLELGVDVAYVRAGEAFAKCPKHRERTGAEDANPSWSVNIESGLHGCWSCQYQGNFVGLVMDLRFPNDAFAANRWIRKFGVDLQEHVGGLRIWGEHGQEQERTAMDLRGKFFLFTPQIPPKWLAARSLAAESAEHYGVRWDEKNKAWIVPIRDTEGKLVGWQSKAADGRFFHNYPLGVKKGLTLFGLDVFERGEPAVLVESPLDVVRLHTAGISNGLATFGSNVTDQQMRIVIDVASELIAAFDNDKAGQVTTDLIVRGDRRKKIPAWSRRIDTWVCNYDGIEAKDVGGMDHDEVHRALGSALHWSKVVTEGIAR